MTTKTKLLTGVTVLTLLIATVVVAGDMETYRPWSETGDLVGLDNHLALGFERLDAFGYAGRSAEDWSRVGQNSFTGLFGWSRSADSGHTLLLRGFGENRADGEFSGAFDLRACKPGTYAAKVIYRRANRFYDGTIEQAYPMPVPGLELDPLPALTWTRGRLDARYRLAERWTVRGYADDIRREGDKASLARGFGGAGLNPPALKTFDTKTMRVGADLFWVGNGLRADVGVRVGKDEGDRARNAAHTYGDDRTSTTVQGGVAWEATDKLTLLGRGASTTMDSKPVEATGAERAVDLEQTSTTSVLAALWRPAKAWSLRVSSRLNSVDVDGGTAEETTIDRNRFRATLSANADWRGTAGTRVGVAVKHDRSELNESLTQNVDGLLPAETVEYTDQTTTTTSAALKVRHRLNPRTSLKANLDLHNVDVDQKWEVPTRYFQGDRTFRTYRGGLGLASRPTEHIRFEAGGEILRRTFERDDVAGVENTFDADRLTGTISWMVEDRLSVFGAMSWGHETADLPASATAPAGAAAIVYDTTTLRLAPGAILSLSNGLRVETQWELVHNRDSVENDYDRLTVRAGYPLGEKATVTAMYRRYEMDENRWDDSILDLYAMGITSRF